MFLHSKKAKLFLHSLFDPLLTSVHFPLPAMPRRKVALEFVVNASSRKASYKKRKKGFEKKMYELSKLCDIKTAAIIYSPYETQPVVLPNHLEATKLLMEFKELPPMERTKRMFDQETFVRQQISKAREKLRKLKIDNREKEMSLVMHRCLEKWEIDQNISKFEPNDLNDLRLVIESQVREINVKQHIMTGNHEHLLENGVGAAQPAAKEDLRQMTSVLERHLREVRISQQASANVQNQMAAQLTWGPFGEGTSTGLGQQQQWTAMELGPTAWCPFGEGTSRSMEYQGQQQQQQQWDELGATTWTALVEEASRGVEQLGQQPTTWIPFGEGSSRGLEQQQWTAVEAQSIEQEEVQQQMMQQRQKQPMVFEQNQPQLLFPWVESIMNPLTPQTMDFMPPLLPLPPGLFGDHCTSGNAAPWEDDSSFRFP